MVKTLISVFFFSRPSSGFSVEWAMKRELVSWRARVLENEVDPELLRTAAGFDRERRNDYLTRAEELGKQATQAEQSRGAGAALRLGTG